MSDDDLRAWVGHLVDDLVGEGPRLDYKEIQGLDTASDRHEVAKDVSSFANEVGGTIVYGIPEDRTADGPPIPCKRYGIAPIRSFESRVENILVDSVQPTLPECRVRPVYISDKPKGVVYVVWTPESWAGVHMVEAHNDRRYYRRGQYRAVEMTEREVRDRYERLFLGRRWVDEFLRSAELNYVATLLPEAYRSHYVVCPVIASESRVDISSRRVRDWLQSHPYTYSQSPYAASPYGARTSLNIDHDRCKWDPYMEIYRNGAISHWLPTTVTATERGMVLADLAELQDVEHFLKYAGLLYSFVGYTGPIRVLVEISHMKPTAMANLNLPAPIGHPWTKLLTHDNVLRMDILDSAMVLVNEPNRILKALADEMFRAYGYWEATCFDENLNLIRR